MTTSNIELELRAEISNREFDKLLTKLQENYQLASHSKRLSIMFLGKINDSNFDMRVRINSEGKVELVTKKGDFHTHDRIEISQDLKKDQAMGIVKTLLLLEFDSKVTERENYNFDLGDGVTLVLVKAGEIAYVEIEKMSHQDDLQRNKERLTDIFSSLGLKAIGQTEFEDLCSRLTKFSDWVFSDNSSDFERLSKLISGY